MSPQKTILVTGATGRQGSGVITALLASPTPYTILAVTRNPTSPASQRLAALSPTLRLIRGFLDDIPSLFAAAAAASPTSRIWGVYSVQVSMGPGVTEDSEVSQGTGLIDAALAHGVAVFVYSSVDRGGDDASWTTPTPIPHFRSKHRIETHLRAAASGTAMAWTVLRPVAFMDNLRPGFATAVFLAALRNHVVPAGGKKVQWVASADIGRFAAMAFADPEGWKGRAVGLAGDELTMDELSGVFERATGRPAWVAFWGFGAALTTLARELGVMIAWFASDGYKADIGARRREYPALMDLETYLTGNKEWQAVAGRGL